MIVTRRDKLRTHQRNENAKKKKKTKRAKKRSEWYRGGRMGVFPLGWNHLSGLIRGKPVIKSAINFTRRIFVGSHSPFSIPIIHPHPLIVISRSFGDSIILFQSWPGRITNNWIPFHQRRTKFNFPRLVGRLSRFSSLLKIHTKANEREIYIHMKKKKKNKYSRKRNGG